MPGNELTIQVGAELDLNDLKSQLSSITNGKDNKITFTTNKEINTQLNNLTKTINEISSKDHQINFHVDQRIFNDLQSIVDGLNNGLTQIGEKAAQQARQMAQAAMRQTQQQTSQMTKQVENLGNFGKIDGIPKSGIQIIDTANIKEADDLIKKIQSGPWNGGQEFTPTTEIDKYNTKLGETITVIKQLNDEKTKLSGENVYDITSKTVETNYQKIEQEAQKLLDFVQKQEMEFDKLYTKAFEQNNPLQGQYAEEALSALQKYQDEYNKVAQAGNVVTEDQKRKMAELRQEAMMTIETQQKLQQAAGKEQIQDYKGLFGQSKEWENALKNITDAENKLNEIQKNAFSGTNALTGDFAKEATRQIDEVKTKFAEIRQAAEQSFDGAASVSKDSLSKMVNDLKADLDRLAKLEYPSDKLAAQNVDVKKAFAADALVEMENRLKSLGNSTTEYYNRVQDLKTLLSSVGQVDSDPSAWANFRNELHVLEDDIKKFESSAQGMGQKLASGIEAGQLQQVVDMVDRLNNINEKFSGTGVEALQQDLQSLASEYMNLMEQLQNPNLTQDQFSAIAKQVQELDTQLKQLTKEAATFGDQNSLDRFASSTASLKLNLEKLENQYSTLIAKNPELAARIEDLKQRLESLRPGELPAITKEISNLGKEMGLASGQSAGLRGALQDAFGGFGTYLARFTSSYFIITKTIQGIKSMVNSVKEVDTSLVELQKVTNLTGTSLSQFTEQAYQAGANLGRTGQDVIDATTTFSRAGYDLQEAAQLAQSALVMTNVGVDIPNIESAASDMISILKAFDVQAEESMSVIDKLYNVANKEPLDFGNITEMLVTAGGTLAQSGTTLEETMGLLTGAFATMRTPAVANGLIMISQRLRGVKEDGEAIEEADFMPKLQEMFSGVGISIQDSNGELRSTYAILNDLAAVWDQLSSKQKQYFGEKVAGNRQVKTLNAIMQNWDVVSDTIDKANNAEGEALKGNEMYMDSIEGRITQLKSAMQELAMATINSDFVKGIVSMGTSVVKLVSDIGGLVPVLTSVLGVVLALKGADIFSGIVKIGGAIKELFTAGSLMSLAGLPGILLAVASAIAMVVAYINNANSAIKKFEEAKQSYEEHKSKVESLNNELQTTQDRITELEGKESLTIVEEKELARLRDVNTQLRTPIELEEKLAEIAQGQAKDAATKVIEEENAKKPIIATTADQIRKEISKNLSDDIIKGIVADQWKTMPLFSDEMSFAPTAEEEVRLRMEAIKQDYAELVKIQEQIANLKLVQAGMKEELDAESDALTENIENNKRALSDYYNWLEKQTEGWEYVEGAKPGSKEAYQNELLDFKKAIGDAILYEDAFNPPINDKAFTDILSKYPEAIKEVQSQIKELGDDWELGVPDSVKEDMRQTQEELAEQAQGILDVFEQFDDESVHNTLGDILSNLLDTGNIEDIKRPIIDAAKMYEAGWEEFKDIIDSDSISTYYSSQYSEIVGDVPFTISVTPIGADGSVLSPEELDDYVYEQIDKAANLEELMNNDKIENGGKGLFIHLTPAIDIDPDTAAQIETQYGEFLHSIDAAFEMARLDTAGGTNTAVADYLKDTLTAGLEDPSYMGQALTEIYTVAQALADNGNAALQDALSQVNIPESIRQGLGIDNLNVNDLGIEHLDELVKELMSKFGFTVEDIERAFKEKFGEADLNVDLGSQMSINVEDVTSKIYQTTDGYTKVLSKALSEQEKSGVLSADTLDKVFNESKLNGVASALERTANGYRLNTDRINELIVAQNKEGQIDAIAGIMERQLAIDELVEKYGSLEAAMQDADAANQINQYQSEIAVLQALADEAESAASALDRLRAAQKSPNQGADYSDAQSALEKTKEAYKEGKIGTDDFKTGMDYLLGDNWQAEFEGDVDKAFKSFEKKRKQYFSGDDFQDATNFAEDLVDKGMLGYDKETGKLSVLQNEATGAAYTLEEMADALGISKDAAQDLFELLNEYSLDDQFTFDTPIDSAEKLAAAQKKLTELEEKRAQLEKEIAEAQEPGGDTTGLEDKKAELEEVTEQATKLSSAIETAQQAMDNGEFEPPQTLEEALAKLKEYEDAITNLNAMKITTPVELQGDFDKLLNFVSGGDGNGNYNIAVKDTGDAQAQLQKINEDIAKIEKARDEGNLSVEIAAEITGSLEEKKGALDAYIAQAEALQKAVPGGSFAAIITFNAETGEWEIAFDEVEADKEKLESSPVQIGFEESKGKSGSAVAEQVEEEVDGIEAPVDAIEGDKTGSDVKSDIEDDVDGIEAPVDAVEGDSTGSDIKSTYEGQVSGIEAPIEAQATNIDGANSQLDEVAKKRKAEIEATVVGDLVQAYVDSHKLEEGKEYNGSGNPFVDFVSYVAGGTEALENLSASAEVEINEDGITDQVQDAVEQGTENAEANVTPEMTEDDWNQFYQEFDEAAGHPFDVEPNVDSGEIADQVEDGIEDGVNNTEPEVGIEANTDGVKEAVDGAVPDVEKVKIEADTTSVPTSITAPEVSTPEVQGSMSMDTSSADNSISTTQSKASETQTMDLDADTSSADSKIDKTQEDASTPQTMPVTTSVNRSALDSVIEDTKKEYNMTVNVTYKETGPKPQAAATGTSNAKGGLSLVDEEGAELIEHKKTGTFELGTNNGARFTHLDKGDVVHTADETKKILSRLGYFGGFFKDGLNKAKSIIGNAFATGVGGSGSKPKKRDVTVGSTGSKKSGSSGSKGSDDDGEDDELKEWTDWMKEFFDWAEIKLQRLKDATSRIVKEAERAIGVWAKNKKIKEAMNSIEKEIEASEKAYKKYMETANEIAKKAGFSADMVKKIQEGTIDVSRYDDVTQQKIKDYQTWYEKAMKVKDAIGDLIDEEKKLVKQRLDNIVDEYESTTKIYKSRVDVAEARRDYRETKGKATKGRKVKEKDGVYLFGSNYGDYAEEIAQEEKAAKQIAVERKKLEKEFKSLIKAGKIKEGDDTWKEYTAKIEDLKKEEYQTRAGIERLKQEAADEALNPYRYKEEKYEYKEDKTTKEMEYRNTQGSESREQKSTDYQKLISYNEKQNEQLEIENQLYKQLQKGLNVNNKEYQDLEKKIRDNKQAILDNNMAIEKYKQSIIQLGIDKLVEDFNNLTSAASALNYELEKKQIKGIEVTKENYETLIENSKASIAILEKQKKVYLDLMDALVAEYGEDAKTSDLYLQYEKQVESIDASIRNADKSVLQWEEDIENIPIKKLTYTSEALKAESQALNDQLSLHKIEGTEGPGDYSALINNAGSLRQAYQAQIDEYKRRQAEYNYDDPRYQEFQRNIESLTDAISKLDIQTAQWREDLKKINLNIYSNIVSEFTEKINDASHQMDMSKLSGENVDDTNRYYSKMANYAKIQIGWLDTLIANYEKEQSTEKQWSEKYIDYQNKINSALAERRNLETSILEWEKERRETPLVSWDWELDSVKDYRAKLEDALNFDRSKGANIYTEESIYSKLIGNADAQRNYLLRENEYMKMLQSGMSFYNETYQEYESKIRSNEAEIRKLDEATVQWRKDIQEIDIKRFSWNLDELKDKSSELQDSLSLNGLKGIDISSEKSIYNNLIANAKRQQEYLHRQNESMKALQAGMSIYSEAYQEYEDKIRSNEAEIRKLDEATIQWKTDIQEIKLSMLSWDLKSIKDYRSELEDILSLNKLKGNDISSEESIFRNLIGNAKTQKRDLLRQNEYMKALQSGMSFYNETYQEYEDRIKSNEAEIRKLDEAIIQWGKDIQEIKLTELSWQLDGLSASIEKLNGMMSLNRAQGLDEVASRYKDLIDYNMERIKLLKEENKLLKNQQKGMSVNSEAYQQLQKQIVDNNNEILNIKTQQEEWNDSIVDIGINNIQKYRDSLSKSNDQLQKQRELQEAIQELQKADSQRKVRTYVEGQGFVYQRDEDDFKQAQENLENIIKDQLLGKLDDLIDALEESKKDTNVYDKNGNLLGTTYTTPQLGSLSEILSKYYYDKNHATIDLGTLQDAFGKNIVSNINPQNNKNTFSIGDIVINEVKDGNELAKTIVDQFPNALLQALYNK